MPEVCDLTPGGYDHKVIIKLTKSGLLYPYKDIRKRGRAQQGEGAAEGRSGNWGEVVTR